jgi:hypothetical protein
MKTAAVIVLLASAASIGFIGWRVHAIHTQIASHFAVVGDASLSYTGGCASVVGLAEEGLRSARLSQGSSITVLMTGDANSANEPRELARYRVPISRKVIEDRHADERRQSEILHDIAARCHAVSPASISPVFMAVKEAIAGLRAQGCRSGSHCELRVASDLEENVEPEFKAALDSRQGTKRSFGNQLDNDGIEVVFCGLATTGGGPKDASRRKVNSRRIRRDSRRQDRLQQLWSSVFKNPEGVRFEPFCPTWSDTGLSRAPGLGAPSR